MKRWVIAGGGYTGAATALHLARHSPQPLRIQLVEPRAQLGAGLAHSAEHPDLRPLESLGLALFLAVFSVGVFVALLGMPLTVWPSL